jgi:hypothetical protein
MSTGELKQALDGIGYTNAKVTSISNGSQITVTGKQPDNLNVTYISSFIGQKLGTSYKKSKAEKNSYIFNKKV